MNTLSALTDEQLYQKAQHYGRNAFLRYLLRKCFISRRTALRFVRVWRQKFIGLLPEVHRRRLYEKKGFGSIFEFSFKLAGLSEQQVRTTLNFGKRFFDKPILKALLENGEVSVNKLVRIQSIATPENETKSLPGHDQNHGQDQKSAHESALRLNEEVTKKLLELQKKGLDVNKVLLELLNRREQEIAEEKETISADLPTTPSRYIPVRVQRILHQEHGDKCSIPTCHKPALHLHHTQRFSLSHNHDPRFLAPLCREHHIIAHSIDANYQKARVAFTKRDRLDPVP